MKPRAFLFLLAIIVKGPLEGSMVDAEENITRTLNSVHPNAEFERKQKEEQKDELLENRYEISDKKEEQEFNRNGN